MKLLALAIILSGCSKPAEKNELPSYSDMGAAQDAQEALTYSK
jgi:PBP1b-binding outer membrane lipoprotein LpoB